MSESAATERLDELLAGRIDRRNFPDLLQHIYASFKSVDHTGGRIRELKEQIEQTSGAERRGLVEKLGILLYAMGKHRQAVEALTAAKARKEAAHFLGRAYLELGETQSARSCLAKGREGDQDLETDVLIAECYCRERDYQEAEKACAKHLDSHGDRPDVLCVLGRTAEVSGEYETAMEYFEKALEHAPEHRQALFRLAYNCDLNGNDERAMELYRRCASVQPTCVGALLNLGVLYEDHGLYDEAIECYKRVLAIEPTHERGELFLRDAESSLALQFDETSGRRARGAGGPFLMANAMTGTQGDEMDSLPAASSPTPDIDEKLNIAVDDLNLSTRSRRCMEKLEITTVGELAEHSERELLASPNFGRKSINELRSKLADLGLELRSD